MSKTSTYRAWCSMVDRCTRASHKQHARYGGRGIAVCDRWASFINFLADMGECPEGLSLDRIDNDGDYEPSNCRWADNFQQSNNTRWNVIYEMAGERKTVSEWGRQYGIKPITIKHRIRFLGWSVENAITTPVKR